MEYERVTADIQRARDKFIYDEAKVFRARIELYCTEPKMLTQALLAFDNSMRYARDGIIGPVNDK